MNTYAAQGALENYRSTGVQTAMESASPHRLIDMLLERGLARIAIAKGHIQRDDVAGRGEHISGAMAIVTGLRTFLDHEAGGSVAANLEALYDYIGRRLVEANLNNDEHILDEVAGLLREVRTAWQAIADEAEKAAAATDAVPA